VAALTKIAETNAETKGRGIGSAALGLLHKKLAIAGSPAERPGHQAAAKKALAAAAAKYADVRISPSQTVAEFAADHLAGIDNIPHLLPGGAAPVETGVDLDGKPLSLADYKGKVVLVDFWATWCPGCMKLVPHLKALSEKHAAAGFAVVGVNLDTDADDLKAEVGRHGIAWRSFKDAGGQGPKLADRWNVEVFPTLYLLDRKGVVRKVWTGGDPEAIAAEVAKVMAEK
jgi:thiol-disulfide isomerase/thioredoxin